MTTAMMIGMAASAVSIAANVVSSWADDKKLDEKIERKVNEALAERDKQNEEDE